MPVRSGAPLGRHPSRRSPARRVPAPPTKFTVGLVAAVLLALMGPAGLRRAEAACHGGGSPTMGSIAAGLDGGGGGATVVGDCPLLDAKNGYMAQLAMRGFVQDAAAVLSHKVAAGAGDGALAEACRSCLGPDTAPVTVFMATVARVKRHMDALATIRSKGADMRGGSNTPHMEFYGALADANSAGLRDCRAGVDALTAAEFCCNNCKEPAGKDTAGLMEGALCIPRLTEAREWVRSAQTAFGVDLDGEVRGHCSECCSSVGPYMLCREGSAKTVEEMFGSASHKYDFECKCAFESQHDLCRPEMCEGCGYTECYSASASIKYDTALQKDVSDYKRLYRVSSRGKFVTPLRTKAAEVEHVDTSGTVRAVRDVLCVALGVDFAECKACEVVGNGVHTLDLDHAPASDLLPPYGSALLIQFDAAAWDQAQATREETERADQEAEWERTAEERRARTAEREAKLAAVRAQQAADRDRQLEEARRAREELKRAEQERVEEEARVAALAKEKAAELQRQKDEQQRAEELAAEERQAKQLADARKAFQQKCRRCHSRAVATTNASREWFGTAIFCNGLCPSNYLPLEWDGSGDGHKCWTGWKVRCERRTYMRDLSGCSDCDDVKYPRAASRSPPG